MKNQYDDRGNQYVAEARPVHAFTTQSAVDDYLRQQHLKGRTPRTICVRMDTFALLKESLAHHPMNMDSVLYVTHPVTGSQVVIGFDQYLTGDNVLMVYREAEEWRTLTSEPVDSEPVIA